MSELKRTFGTEGANHDRNLVRLQLGERRAGAAPAIASDSPAPPKPAPGLRVRVTPAGPALWSVEDAAGRIIGHLQSIEHPLGTRWRTRRHHVRAGGFLTLGEFWAIDDAVAALRMN